MNIIRTGNYKEMSRKAANIISAAVIMNPHCVLGLATGSTPIGVYEQLVDRYQKGDLDFSQVKSINLDEYKGLARENEQSYYYFMDRKLFSKVNIKPENIYLPDGMEKNSEKACAEYEQIIKTLGGIDLQLLGLGHNGHIGFNEPSDEFIARTHCVNLTTSTIEANKRFFASYDAVPKQAYTMGIRTIMSAKKILLVINGKDKAEILKEALLGPVTPRIQASVLQLHPDVTVIADEAALSLINK